MSSYNNIQKIKYVKNPTDVVSLFEYITFEDTRAKEKFVVFKFFNNVNQRLSEFSFEVLQYNKDNELLEKSVAIHKDFIAEANETFVPNAKLKINFECESLEVRLVSATFDRAVWRDGEFTDSAYKFDTYAQWVNNAQTAPAEEKKPKEKVKKKTPKNTEKESFNIRNIFRRNKAVFPVVFNVIMCVIFIGLVIFSAVYFKKVTGAFTVDNFIVKESSAGYVTILKYSGSEEKLEIPAMLEDYYVDKIADGAFANSNIANLVINTQKALTVEKGAFSNCKKLSVVTSTASGSVTLMEGSFKNCTALTSFNVPTAKLCSKCFDGTNNIKSLVFDGVVFTNGRLLDVFNGLDSITFDYLYMRTNDVPMSFYEGVNGN